METSALKFTRWTSLTLLVVLAIGFLHAGWRLQSVWRQQKGIEATENKVELRLEEMASQQPFKAPATALRDVKPEVADKKIRELKKQIQTLETQLGIKSEAQLETAFSDFEKAIRENAALSHPPELVETLLEKATAFHVVAENKRWRNLAIYGERLTNRIRSLRGQSVTSPQVKFAESDVAAMERLARTLDDRNRDEVLNRMTGIRAELEMLKEAHTAGREVSGLESQSQAAFTRWLGRARLAAGALEARAQERMEGALREIWILGAMALLSALIMAGLWPWARRSQRHLSDVAFMELLRNGVLQGEETWRKYVGEARHDEVSRTLRQARKRMALGEDLQASLPLGVVLVNSEGRLMWSNPVFSEQFGLDDDALIEEDLRWDNFSARLVTDGQSSVERALENSEPGTWQVRAEIEPGVFVPFEMHVSPLESGLERRALVLFYPLALLKSSIDEQARLLMAPVREVIDSIENGVEPSQHAANLWVQAGLGEDWNRLSRSLMQLEGSRRELLSQVELLENQIHDQTLRVRELEAGLHRRQDSTKVLMHTLKEFKDGLMSIDELEAGLGQDHAALLEEARGIAKRSEQAREAVSKAEERLDGAKEAVAQLERIKQECKATRLNVIEGKTLMVRAQNRFLSILPSMDNAAMEMASEMKEQLMRMDEAVAQLDTRLSQLDVQITKVAMTCQGASHDPAMTGRVAWDLALHERNAHETLQHLREDQDMVVGLMKKMVEVLRQEQQETQQLLMSHIPGADDEASPYSFV